MSSSAYVREIQRMRELLNDRVGLRAIVGPSS